MFFGIIYTSIQEHPELKLVFHGRKVEKFGRSISEIKGLVTATRLTPLITCLLVNEYD